jgi:ATP-dependent protease ClpP protease subunit
MRKANEETYDEISSFTMNWYRFDDDTVNLFYTGQISPTFIQDVLATLEVLDYKKFRLILNSPGGDATIVKIAPLMLKQCGLKEIITTTQCSSAALAICLEAKKLRIPVYMDIFTHVVLHKAMQTDIIENRSSRIENFNVNFVKNFEELFDEINKPILKKLTKEERDNYKNGHNVYFLADKLIEWGIFKAIDPTKFKYTLKKQEEYE